MQIRNMIFFSDWPEKNAKNNNNLSKINSIVYACIPYNFTIDHFIDPVHL